MKDKKPGPNFTMESLLEELLERMPALNDGEAMTTAEMATALDISEDTMRTHLAYLKENELIRVARKRVPTLNNRMTTVTAWIAVKPEE